MHSKPAPKTFIEKSLESKQTRESPCNPWLDGLLRPQTRQAKEEVPSLPHTFLLAQTQFFKLRFQSAEKNLRKVF
ncbi:MAG: hypothetical protein US49_C0009G0008 [candidate division TM6 bacterium GW2011_GWF2_37_49]|nr:MAG: hypothetical protein US49_C0009G0008 [candidate division TM6 bacterium GW2011_GWF2_37_49]